MNSVFKYTRNLHCEVMFSIIKKETFTQHCLNVNLLNVNKFVMHLRCAAATSRLCELHSFLEVVIRPCRQPRSVPLTTV